MIVSFLFNVNAAPCIAGWTSIFELQKTGQIQLTTFNDFGKKNEFLVSIPHGKVLEAGLVITSDNLLLDDTTVLWNKTIDQHPLIAKEIDENKITFHGTLAIVASAGQQNYYHWMFQILPRIALLKQANVPYDKLYFYDIKLPFQFETLEMLGIKPDDIIIGSPNTFINADKIIVPSIPIWPSRGKLFNIWVQDFLIGSFAKISKEPIKKLYISRSHATLRRIINEHELIEFLNYHNFEIIYPEDHSVSEQANIFSKASIIIGSHGTGLTNIVFAPYDTSVIEINSPANHRNPYRLLAESRNINYHLYEPSIDNLTEEQKENDDVIIDITDFKKFFENVICENNRLYESSTKL